MLGQDSELKPLEQKRTSGNFRDVSGEVLPSTTAEACIALLFVQSEDYIVNDVSADPIILCTTQFASPTQVSDNTIASTTTD